MQSGWAWFDVPEDGKGGPDNADTVAPDIALAFARCFATVDGKRVLDHLRRTTLERSLGPGASDAVLRHVEGQRHLVAQILALTAQGAKER
jgi:hypothetical protein